MLDPSGQYGTLPIPTGIPAAEARSRAARVSQPRSGRIARLPPHGHHWPGRASTARLRRSQRPGQHQGPFERFGYLVQSVLSPSRSRRPSRRSPRYAAWSQSRNGAAHSSYSKSSAKRPRYEPTSPIDLHRFRLQRKRLDQVATVIASTCDEFRIQPDQVGIVVDVTRGEVVYVVLLKHAPQEVDGLVEGVQGIRGIEFGPERIQDLITRAGHTQASSGGSTGAPTLFVGLKTRGRHDRRSVR